MVGAWGYGLYDNDAALGVLADQFEELPLDESPTHLAAGLGLRIWLLDDAPEFWTKEIDDLRELVAQLPDVAQRAIAEAAQRDEPERWRAPELRAVLGDHCDGRRIDALFDVAGVRPLVVAFAAACREALSDALSSPNLDAYELTAALGPLGPLLELNAAGYTVGVDPDELVEWKHAIDRCDSELDDADDRGFFDVYFARARAGLTILG